MSKRLFSASTIDKLIKEQAHTINEIAAAVERILTHKYSTDKGKEHGHHGFSRRLRTISRALERVFDLVPPDLEHPPEREERIDAEAYLQALIVAAYGAAENLAAIWVSETGLLRADGRPLPDTWIGLRPGNTTVRASLPEPVRNTLGSFDGWFDQIENYRHALAHRIPFYIPPYSVSDENVKEYSALEQQKLVEISKRNFDAFDQIELRQKQMEFFQPLIVHSWGEDARPIVFHSMAIVAARTVNKMGEMIFDSLDGVSLARGRDSGTPELDS
jgi:hypothetical protein